MSCRRTATRTPCAASSRRPPGTMPTSPAFWHYSEVRLPCQMHRLDSVAHHPPQQTYEQLGAQSALIGAVPESTVNSYRRGGPDGRGLARALDHRCLPLDAPGPAMDGIGPKA